MQIVIGIFLILVLVLILLVVLLLFVPVRVIARSGDHHYAWQWGKLVSGILVPNRKEPQKSFLKLKILFWSKEIYPFRKRKAHKKSKKKKRKPRRSFIKPERLKSRLVPVLNSFKVEHFRVNLDTDDYVLNGILYPVFHALTNDRRRLEINFNGIVDLDIQIQNKGWKLLYAFLR